MTEPGYPDGAIWLEAAANPEIVAMEQQAGELYDLESRYFKLVVDLSKYYWNRGLPHTTLDVKPGVWMGHEANRMSFALDRPSEIYKPGPIERFLRREKSGNDEIQRGRVLHDVNSDVRIVEKDEKQFLVKGKKHVISPKFDSVMPLEDGSFVVTSGEESGRLLLLSPEEQQALVEDRTKLEAHRDTYDYQELVGLQHETALATLALYGISVDPEVTRRHSASNVKELHFNYADSQVRMSVGGAALRVMSWGEELTREEVHEVWRAYDGEKGIKSIGMQLSILLSAIDKGPPDWLKPYEDRIMAEIDETDQAQKIFLASMRELFERNNFRPFSIETPHPSWSIPTAMKLLETPFDEAYPFIAPYGTDMRGHLHQVVPGTFAAGYNDPKPTWGLNSSGELVEK